MLDTCYGYWYFISFYLYRSIDAKLVYNLAKGAIPLLLKHDMIIGISLSMQVSYSCNGLD
jgi:hypothetical protein